LRNWGSRKLKDPLDSVVRLNENLKVFVMEAKLKIRNLDQDFHGVVRVTSNSLAFQIRNERIFLHMTKVPLEENLLD
jgi:hypothetical protein